MIIVTGGAGFIGSCIARRLNENGRDNLIIVDQLGEGEKWKNLRNISYAEYINKYELFEELHSIGEIEAIIHMGACSATTERDADYLMENNYRYSVALADFCVTNDIRFIYASSAATYGSEEAVCLDDETTLESLQPMNMYGYSKQLFDLKARREGWLDKIAGLKFFNVYGPNEYHKGDMSSVIFKAFNQIQESGKVRLFKSHRPDFKDGLQKRDFVYVKDAAEIVMHLLEHPKVNGIYNAGSGEARTFKDLVTATFQAMSLEPKIEYIDIPEAIRDRYQYYTQADMSKLRATGFEKEFHSLEAGVGDYVKNYLMQNIRNY
ncbi:MAG: ADP-glyceromanno-heptose 6-epimerase [Ectothiorhodospiraceae bacterium]|nr:ADP-glyceromanno-heptose 6-epimerase [Ectothiorhodospiraceae bacterium]